MLQHVPLILDLFAPVSLACRCPHFLGPLPPPLRPPFLCRRRVRIALRFCLPMTTIALCSKTLPLRLPLCRDAVSPLRFSPSSCRLHLHPQFQFWLQPPSLPRPRPRPNPHHYIVAFEIEVLLRRAVTMRAAANGAPRGSRRYASVSPSHLQLLLVPPPLPTPTPSLPPLPVLLRMQLL